MTPDRLIGLALIVAALITLAIGLARAAGRDHPTRTVVQRELDAHVDAALGIGQPELPIEAEARRAVRARVGGRR